jgi:hypothetical protein
VEHLEDRRGHRHAAQQHQLNIQTLLLEKSLFASHPERAVTERLARCAEIDLGPLLSLNRDSEQQHSASSNTKPNKNRHGALREEITRTRADFYND